MLTGLLWLRLWALAYEAVNVAAAKARQVSRKLLPAALREVTKRLRQAVTADTHLRSATAPEPQPASVTPHHLTAAAVPGPFSSINPSRVRGAGLSGGMSDVLAWHQTEGLSIGPECYVCLCECALVCGSGGGLEGGEVELLSEPQRLVISQL